MSFFTDVAFPWIESPDIEGGGKLSLDPEDPGNWTGGSKGAGILKGTKYGVAAADFPDLDIPNLTYDQAGDIAYNRYWVPAGCDSLPPSLALCVFDFAYNSGVHESVKVLQRTIGAVQDGIAGPDTFARVATWAASALVRRFTDTRIAAYQMMAGWGRFGDGWRSRAIKTQNKALSI